MGFVPVRWSQWKLCRYPYGQQASREVDEGLHNTGSLPGPAREYMVASNPVYPDNTHVGGMQMPIRNDSMYPLLEPIPCKLFVVRGVPGGKRKPSDDKKLQSQSSV